MTFQKGHTTFKGRKHSDETRAKISIANKGRIFSDEWKKNLSDSHKGQVSWCKGKKLVDEKVSKEKRKAWLKTWKEKNHEKLLLQGRASYNRNVHNRRKFSREFYWKNKKSELDRIRFKKYGITGDEFRVMLDKQEEKCLVCKQTDEKNLSVDHDHSTGMVRGIICNRCNMALGNVGDSPKILRALADYLEKHYDQTISTQYPDSKSL
jgi:hypothetical protein